MLLIISLDFKFLVHWMERDFYSLAQNDYVPIDLNFAFFSDGDSNSYIVYFHKNAFDHNNHIDYSEVKLIIDYDLSSIDYHFQILHKRLIEKHLYKLTTHFLINFAPPIRLLIAEDNKCKN